MPVKIRLQRHGKKGKPFYWVVAADARAKRDGRYLEKLGTYNPNSNPASVDLNIDHAVSWLEKGAQPTDTARTLLSYKGVMLKHHLNGGVRKGALTQEQADTKFAAWLEEKETKIQAKKDGLTQAESDARAKRLADEKAVSDKRLADAAAAEAEVKASEAAEAAAEVEVEAAEAAEVEVEAAEAAEAAAEAEATEATEAVEEAAAEETTEAVAEEAPAAEATEEEAAPEANEASEEKEG
jgi:small subunit ribosomal protein S16